jgi:hypothetical protein
MAISLPRFTDTATREITGLLLTREDQPPAFDGRPHDPGSTE